MECIRVFFRIQFVSNIHPDEKKSPPEILFISLNIFSISFPNDKVPVSIRGF